MSTGNRERATIKKKAEWKEKENTFLCVCYGTLTAFYYQISVFPLALNYFYTDYHMIPSSEHKTTTQKTNKITCESVFMHKCCSVGVWCNSVVQSVEIDATDQLCHLILSTHTHTHPMHHVEKSVNEFLKGIDQTNIQNEWVKCAHRFVRITAGTAQGKQIEREKKNAVKDFFLY